MNPWLRRENKQFSKKSLRLRGIFPPDWQHANLRSPARHCKDFSSGGLETEAPAGRPPAKIAAKGRNLPPGFRAKPSGKNIPKALFVRRPGQNATVNFFLPPVKRDLPPGFSFRGRLVWLRRWCKDALPPAPTQPQRHLCQLTAGTWYSLAAHAPIGDQKST